MTSRAILAALAATLLPATLAAQATGNGCTPGLENQWQRVTVVRHVPPDRSVAQVQQLLLSEARRAAVEQSVGITVSFSASRTQYEAQVNGESKEYRDNFFVLNSQDATGLIVEEKFTATRRGADSLAVNYEARVGCDAGALPAGFEAEVLMNQETYRDKDPVTISVQASDSARVFLFSVLQDGSARLIFPNRLDTDNVLRPDTKRQVPRAGAPYSLPAELDTRFGASQNEMVLAIFYLGQGPAPFRTADAFEKAFTLEEINRVLLLIPRHQRLRLATGYEIRARATQ